MSLTLHSRLSLIPIEIRKDKKHYIVEDQSSGEFYEMPEVCIAAINLINRGEQLGEIEQVLKEKYPKEEVDLLDFAAQLLELKLINEIDGIKVENQQKQKEGLHFLSISPKRGKFFFNKFAYIVYFTLFILNIILFTTRPSLFPHYKDVFVFDYMFLNILLWMGLTFILVLFHEFGHVLAMRANNLPTRIDVGHRLFIIVLETDMSSVWKLAPKDRNVLFLAGLCFDTVILSFALICQLVLPNGSGIFFSLLNLAILDIFMRIIYQCCFYMKTDLYFVFENISGSYNLMESAQQAIRKRIPFIKSSSKNEVVFASERKTVFFYSIFYFVGVVLTTSLFIIFYLPQLYYAGRQVMPGLIKAPSSLAFWDAALFSVQIMIVLFLLLYSWRKKYLRT